MDILDCQLDNQYWQYSVRVVVILQPPSLLAYVFGYKEILKTFWIECWHWLMFNFLSLWIALWVSKKVYYVIQKQQEQDVGHFEWSLRNKEPWNFSGTAIKVYKLGTALKDEKSK